MKSSHLVWVSPVNAQLHLIFRSHVDACDRAH